MTNFQAGFYYASTTSIRILCDFPMLMKEQYKSIIVLDLQIYQLHKTNF